MNVKTLFYSKYIFMSKVCLTICEMLFCSFRALLHHQHMCCFDTKTCVSTSTSPTHVLLNTKTYVLAHQPHQHMCCFDTKTCVSAHQPHPRMCCSTQRLMCCSTRRLMCWHINLTQRMCCSTRRLKCCSTRRLMCWHINLTNACAAQHEDLCAGTSTSPMLVIPGLKDTLLAHCLNDACAAWTQRHPNT